VEGINPDSIRNLFGLNGSTSNSGVSFLVGSDNTVAYDGTVQVDILQAAEQATATASNALSETIVIDSSNRDFRISFNGGDTTEFQLQEGTYTREEFAAQVQSVINNSTSDGAQDVSVSVDGDNKLVITTDQYGSDAQLDRILGGALGFTGAESGQGVDVVGSFIVDGVTETAVGRGQILTANTENSEGEPQITADIQLLVSLTPDQVDTGTNTPESELTITRGITSQLDLFLDEVLDAETGTLSTINEEFDAQIASVDESIERVVAITDARREALIAEFSALESVLANLQNTGNILASQLSNLGGISAN
jgi:flagellar hook-associated protein 2